MKKKFIIIILIVLLLLSVSFIIYYNSSYAIILNGDSKVEVILNHDYTELGAKTIFNSKIRIEGSVDTTKVGEYKIRYYHGKKYIERTIYVKDNEAPVIILNGLGEVNTTLNGQYIELGAVATDNYDGDITSKIEIESNLDLKTEGTYKIIYSVKDSSGNISSVERIINVNKKGPLSLSMKDFKLDGYFTNTILKETNDMGSNYIDETIFYGDSITFNFFYYGQLKQSNVWAMSSLTPESALTLKVPFYKYNDEISLIDGLKKYKPKRIIITLGANAVAVTTKDFFISSYEELIKKAKEASPETTIIVQSIFPVDNRYNSSKSLNNVKINNYNYYLAEMCERNGVYFLNTEEVLKDTEGYLIKSYCYSSDGIHLLPSGNIAVINYIRKHGVIDEKNSN